MAKKVCDINNMNACNCPLATGEFKGGGKGATPKMPEVTRSPCQPKILVAVLHKMCSF